VYYNTDWISRQPVGLHQTLAQLADPDQLAVINNRSITGYNTDSDNAIIFAKSLADRINCQYGADVEPTAASESADVASELIAYYHCVKCRVDVHDLLLFSSLNTV